MMEVEIHVPEQVPVMTLPNVAFFPQALLPLHIFEPRYRAMLRDVLSSNRIFAVAGLDSGAALSKGRFEPPYRVACLGLVRACQKNENGTSNLLLQGLCRVAIEAIVADEPYRRIRVRALASEPGADAHENARLRKELSRLIGLKMKLTPGAAAGMTELLGTVEDPEVFADIAAFNLCESAPVKQRLLETLEVNRRLLILLQVLRTEIDEALMQNRMQGGLPDDQISLN
jgi:ATP-dependent Lon protease